MFVLFLVLYKSHNHTKMCLKNFSNHSFIKQSSLVKTESKINVPLYYHVKCKMKKAKLTKTGEKLNWNNQIKYSQKRNGIKQVLLLLILCKK